MKNKLLSIVIFFLLLLMPINAFAAVGDGAGKEYASMNLKELLADEEMEQLFSNYEETDEQITIYLFRGKGCTYCRAFLTYINSIVDEYGDYFKIKSYEVWYDTKNATLMTDVSEFLDQTSNGVPYIIVGDKVFAGYADVYNESIIDAIMELYNSKNRYDVFEEMKKEEMLSSISNIAVICSPIVSIVGIIAVSIYTNKKYKKLNQRIDELEQKIKDNTKNKEDNKITKKDSNKEDNKSTKKKTSTKK